MVRWLSRGGRVNMELEAGAGLTDWVDTGIDVVAGDTVAITCSGTITMFGNSNWGPTGNPSWSSRGKAFSVGAVLGKLGANGNPFLIGASKQWTAESNDRLYVRIYCPDDVRQRGDFNESGGQFDLRIATGAWAGELGASLGK